MVTDTAGVMVVSVGCTDEVGVGLISFLIGTGSCPFCLCVSKIIVSIRTIQSIVDLYLNDH